MTYKIIYKEVLHHEFEVEANSREEAEKEFGRLADAGEIDFSDGEVIDTETTIELGKLDRYDVPQIVGVHINEYFQEHLPEYEVCHVERLSNFQLDSYLYMVVGYYEQHDSYAVWTCWNEQTKCLNCGHYMLTRDEAYEVLDDVYKEVE